MEKAFFRTHVDLKWTLSGFIISIFGWYDHVEDEPSKSLGRLNLEVKPLTR